MSADLLRRAATVLRERAQRSADQTLYTAWASDGEQVTCGAGNWMIVATTRDAPDPDDTHPNAVYIATMDPLVGLALADWLDRAAWAEDMSGYKPQVPHKDHALTVARAVLGGAS